MILVLIIAVLVVGGLLAWALEGLGDAWPRWTALAATAVAFALACILWLGPAEVPGGWISEVRGEWIPRVGIGFHLAADGLSVLMLVLTGFLGILAVGASWTEVRERVGFFHFNLCWILAGVVGVFTALDLFLFYFFWELMIVPMYLLIGIWGHENRHYAAMKFFIFTQASGLLMLLSILGLYFIHGRASGTYTFDYVSLLGTKVEPATARWLMLGFFVAFVVKLPAVPFHTWLPDAHTEAPTAGSVILAGLLLKTGAYGLLRFVGPLFPQAATDFAPVAIWLGAAGVVYGAVMAFAQTDLKRLVAYTSVSHLGFVLIGVFSWNEVGHQGAVLQMICHGVSTGALFIIVGGLQERIHTREMGRMGGFWPAVPRMGAMALVFTAASLGLPGLGNFVGEFLALLGAYRANVPAAAVASLGLVAATVYSLTLFDRTFFGPPREGAPRDLGRRELAVLGSLVVAIVWLGLWPQSVIDAARPALDAILRAVHA